MANTIPQFLNLPGNRKIAYQTNMDPAKAPVGILWANGFKSDMTSIKARRVSQWAGGQNIGCVRFDYSGHGLSSGRFEDGTIGDWAEECSAIFNQITQGPQIMAGSSMGAWIILLTALAHIRQVGPEHSRIKGIILLAPAIDMTEDLIWQNATQDMRHELETTGVYMLPSNYGDGPYPITLKLIEEGRNHLLFSGEKINTHCPVRIIHGLEDTDVPWQHSQKLVNHLVGENVKLELVENGDHRLSRDQDIERLFATMAEFS